MTVTLEVFFLLLCLLGSALYSGSEIGFYSLSRAQMDLEASRGGRRARLVSWLASNDSALLVTILIGNNLVLELSTKLGEALLSRAFHFEDHRLQALSVACVLTPLVFLFGEALPKDLFRRRPGAFTRAVAPFLAASRVVYWPLERALRVITIVLERLIGVKPDRTGRLDARESLAIFLAEGRRHGALSARAEELARNALRLRSIPVSRAMVPWSRVVKVQRHAPLAEAFAVVREARASRLPVVTEDGAIEGYIHQLEVLQEWDPEGAVPDVFTRVRPLERLDAATPVDRALLRLQGLGRRIALVEDAGRPVGIVSLKDLLEEISGDLAGM
ncbi:MAG: CNNM domain-containing protein [Planctomycetota bacterium]